MVCPVFTPCFGFQAENTKAMFAWNRYYLVLVSRETGFPGEFVEGQGKSSLKGEGFSGQRTDANLRALADAESRRVHLLEESSLQLCKLMLEPGLEPGQCSYQDSLSQDRPMLMNVEQCPGSTLALRRDVSRWIPANK